MPENVLTEDLSDAYNVIVFAEEAHLGSDATIYYCFKAVSDSLMQSVAKTQNSAVTCFIQASQNLDSFYIKTFNQSTEIKLCGHGLLASAHWLKTFASAKQFANYEIDLNRCQFVLSSGELVSLKDDGNIWLKFRPIDHHLCDTPSWLEKVFSVKPLQAATVGADNGYWIFEWHKDNPLSDLTIDFEGLKKLSQRSVIATQVSDKDNFDFNLRYFAPQYGANEDNATGSANRILAAYWAQKKCKILKKQSSKLMKFRALQQSANGAVIYSAIDKANIWIGGQVSFK